MFGMKKKIYLIFGDVDGQSFHKYFYGYPTECIKEKRILSEEWVDLVISNRYEFTHIKNAFGTEAVHGFF